ncbi:MAG: ferritin family protein [Syntrophomonadaceae bacterium]|nr:ferritin family protein [Syntrophomonadaceae bacterium]MDD3350569.1 ferritin family protein [Eubacteriales bacterium]
MEELKCLVCGMKINSKNYKLNENSFAEKNEIDNIINCPFCGVGEAYLDCNREGYSLEDTSLDQASLKVLEKAMKLEVFNGGFYQEAGKMAKEEALSLLFQDLSKIEFMHAKIHMKLAAQQTLPELHKPDYSRHDTDELLLQEACKREKHAIEFYEKNSDKVSDGTLKKILTALADVEKQHAIITGESKI